MISRRERQARSRSRIHVVAFDLLFYPWMLMLLILPMLPAYLNLTVLQERSVAETYAEVERVQNPVAVADEWIYITFELLEPANGRVQIMLSGNVIVRFANDPVSVTAPRGALVEIDARTELRPVHVRVIVSTGQYPGSGQEFFLHQETRPLIIR